MTARIVTEAEIAAMLEFTGTALSLGSAFTRLIHAVDYGDDTDLQECKAAAEDALVDAQDVPALAASHEALRARVAKLEAALGGLLVAYCPPGCSHEGEEEAYQEAYSRDAELALAALKVRA